MTAHEDAQQLLAGHALRALSPADAGHLETLLTEHVPACPECLRALDQFDATVGEMAFAIRPVAPPQPLWNRLRRQTAPARRSRSRWVTAVAGAAVVAVLFGFTVWSVHLTTRAETQQQRATDLIHAVSGPRSRVVPMSSLTPSRAGLGPVTIQVAAAYVPGRGGLLVFGSMPPPKHRYVYQLWIRHHGVFRSLGTFTPDANGTVFLRLHVNPAHLDLLLITEEPRAGSPAPSDRTVVTATL